MCTKCVPIQNIQFKKKSVQLNGLYRNHEGVQP